MSCPDGPASSLSAAGVGEGTRGGLDSPSWDSSSSGSGVGLGITTATWATGGAALPVRVGASVTKAAKRTGRLAAPLLDDMAVLARQAIDMPRLKTDLAGLDATDIAGLRRVAGKHLETARHSHLVATLDNKLAALDFLERAAAHSLQYSPNSRLIPRLRPFSQKCWKPAAQLSLPVQPNE